MRLLLVHLSDIHITNSTDHIINKSSAIVDAVKNLDLELNLCVVVISGDIAYSGTSEQYEIVFDFLSKINNGLSQKLCHKIKGEKVPIHFILVPGNHDCQFSGATAVREHNLETAYSKMKEPEFQDLFLEVQQPFFDFLGCIANFESASTLDPDYDKRIAHEYEISLHDEKISFICLNTAWVSRKKEKQGTIVFPTEAIPARRDGYELVVTVQHHPFNWLESNNARILKKKIEKIADVMLTGHEHDSSRRTQFIDSSEIVTHIEGAMLQDSADTATSQFNAIVINTSDKRQKFVYFSWSEHEKLYLPSRTAGCNTDVSLQLEWEDLPLNKARKNLVFEIDSSFKKFLDDPGVALKHRRGNLILSDFFVFPNLTEINYLTNSSPRTAKAEHILDLVLSEERLLITGDTQSGKTSLGKILFQRLSGLGKIPLWLSGAETKRLSLNDDDLYAYLEECFVKQYSPRALNQYRQLDRERRVIIIDDYDKLQMPPNKKQRLASLFAKYAGHVLLLAYDFAQGIDEITRPAGEVLFSQFRIQPLNQVLRGDLIDRWFALHNEIDQQDRSIAQKIAEVRKNLNTIVGVNYVPSFPVYVLSILQAAEADIPINSNASTHGYFYELFIKATLLKNRSQKEYDLILSYLSFLAYRVFESRAREFSAQEFQNYHGQYEHRYDLQRSYEAIRSQLLDQGVLKFDGEFFTFRYEYLYYFFVANYFKMFLHTSDVRAHITQLSRRLFRSESANILLFLAHLSRDPYIINEMLAAAKEHYQLIVPASLERDVDFINRIQERIESVVYEEIDIKESQRGYLEQLDRTDDTQRIWEARTDALEESHALIDPVAQLGAALRSMQILGQILKNFVGSIEADTKLNIVRECLGIGLRMLTFVISLFEQNENEFLHEIVDILKTKYPSATNEQTAKRAQQVILALSRLASFGVIKRISQAVGSPDLNRTYSRILEATPSAANKLINAALALEHAGDFPERLVVNLADEFSKNYLAHWILQAVVLDNFAVFPIAPHVKQRMCDKLSVQYKPSKFFDQTRRLILDHPKGE